MTREDIKRSEDAKKEAKYALEALIAQEKILRDQLSKLDNQFNNLTIEIRNSMVQRATDGFAEYFSAKDFDIEGDKIKTVARYGELSITLNPEGEYSFSIQLRKQREMIFACLVSVQPTESTEAKDKKAWVDEIKQDSTFEFGHKQIATLQHNKSVMENTLVNLSDLKFVYKLQEYYFGDKTEYDRVEQILELLADKSF
mgnify:CR=1 FL=1